ncbi:hypothetical protein [Bacillus sp. FJAT-45350]|uniref:hypothetical protein n=1 Tax=Bacillus sp. FJAT-45350 TaxID=2011014 RepID=UPI0015CAF337|nr:hypothetical protein [Bacillus sp. FJAT-45350]
MIPTVLIQLALIIIIARCGYKAITLINSHRKPWFEILFYLSVVIFTLSFLL